MQDEEISIVLEALDDLMETLSAYYRHEFTEEAKKHYQQAHRILYDEMSKNRVRRAMYLEGTS